MRATWRQWRGVPSRGSPRYTRPRRTHLSEMCQSSFVPSGIRFCLVRGSVGFGRRAIRVREVLPSALQLIRQLVHSPLGRLQQLLLFSQRSLCSAGDCPRVRRIRFRCTCCTRQCFQLHVFTKLLAAQHQRRLALIRS